MRTWRKTAFLVFYNESRRTKVPKPYSRESMSSGTFKDISQSDRPRTRSVKTTNKRHRGAVSDRVHKENYSIDYYYYSSAVIVVSVAYFDFDALSSSACLVSASCFDLSRTPKFFLLQMLNF